MKYLNRTLLAAALTTFSATSYAAMANLLDFHPFPEHYTYVGAEGSYTDSQRGKIKAGDVHNYWQPAVNLGYRWSPLISLQAQYGRVRTHLQHKLPGESNHIRDERMSIGARVHMYNTQIFTMQPYVGLGYNRHIMKPSWPVGDEKENMVFGEAGLQRMLSNRFFMDVGYRGLLALNHDRFYDNQFYAALNFITTGANNHEVAHNEPKPVDDYPMMTAKPAPKCTNVPAGAKVDADGCPIKLDKPIKITLHINFPFDSSVVPTEYRGDVKRISDSLVAYPDSNVSLVGHTDNIGTQDYNQGLSERRANAVKNMLVDDFNVNGQRVSTSGRSYNEPVAPNTTSEGRAENRRVEATISGHEKVYKAVDGKDIPVKR